MNAPELAFRANANRPVPGVNVPVAPPSCALEETVAASCWSVRPLTPGNWLGTGRCAGPGAETAGGGRAVVGVLAAAAGVLVLVLEEEELLLDDPHPARASAPAATRPR